MFIIISAVYPEVSCVHIWLKYGCKCLVFVIFRCGVQVIDFLMIGEEQEHVNANFEPHRHNEVLLNNPARNAIKVGQYR